MKIIILIVVIYLTVSVGYTMFLAKSIPYQDIPKKIDYSIKKLK